VKKGKVMAVRSPRYSKEEFARRGDEIYETQVRPQVEAGNHGKIVAIDIETGSFEIADEILTATGSLFQRIPTAQPWIVRIGQRAVHRFGSRSLKKTI
jgi:peptide subunit release factor RF-3